VFQILRPSLPPIFKLTPEAMADVVVQFKSALDQNLELKVNTARTQPSSTSNKYWDEMLFMQAKQTDMWKNIKPELYTIFWYIQL